MELEAWPSSLEMIPMSNRTLDSAYQSKTGGKNRHLGRVVGESTYAVRADAHGRGRKLR